MILKFPQFKTEIVNPTVEANIDTIALQPSKGTISVDLTLSVKDAFFGVNLTDIKVDNFNYEGIENLLERVNERLKDFEV